MKLVSAAALAVLALSHPGDATQFLSPTHASLVAKEMPITKHEKEAGDGYSKGSPLYEKQQKLAKDGAPKVKAAVKSDPVAVSVPTSADGVTWHTVYGDDKTHLTRGLYAFLSYFIMTMLVALIWIKFTSPGRTKEGYDERKNNPLGFAYGLFAWDHCFGHHASVCLCSWCCAPLRLADTYSKEPTPLVKSFWAALVMITCLLGLQHLTFQFTSLLFVCMATYFRQALRKKYGLESGGSTVFMDCFSWLCCPFCTMAQEARQVEFVLPVKR